MTTPVKLITKPIMVFCFYCDVVTNDNYLHTLLTFFQQECECVKDSLCHMTNSVLHLSDNKCMLSKTDTCLKDFVM